LESVPAVPPKLVSTKEKTPATTRPAAPGRAAEQQALVAPPPPSPPRPVSEKPLSLTALVEKVRQSDSRYQLIRVRLSGSTVIVRPGEGSSEDATHLAQQLRRVKGVSEVLLENE